LALHLNAGEEAAVLNTGNLFSITAAGAEHPLVKQRMAKRPTTEDQALMDRVMRHGLNQTDHDRKRAAQNRYKADTIAIYLDAVTTLVWGRDARRLMKFTDAMVERAQESEAERLAA